MSGEIDLNKLVNGATIETIIGKETAVVENTSYGIVMVHGGNNTDVSHYVNDARSRNDAVSVAKVPAKAYADLPRWASVVNAYYSDPKVKQIIDSIK
jgi:hypothetical protein